MGMCEHGFRARPNSVMVEWQTGKGRGGPMRWYPLLMLVWTFWIVATPFFDPNLRLVDLTPTLCALAVFLVIYYIAYFHDRRYLVWCASGMALLGFAITPTNPGAHGFLIYACAFFAFCGPPRQSLRLMTLALGLYAAECVWLGEAWLFPISTVLVGFVVGLMNISVLRNVQINADLKLSHDEVRRLAAVAERERIGRDLHDLLGHTLSLIALKSELATRLWDRDPHAARREVLEVERITREALAQVRHAVTGIRAAGLAAELASSRLTLESGGVAFTYDNGDQDLPVEIETCLAMAVRESVTNIVRHARATRASVSLRRESTLWILDIDDDGRGGDIVPGNGLTGMRERLHGIGATLTVDSLRGRGTHLRITLPARTEASAVRLVAPDSVADAPCLPSSLPFR
ncbi:MAG: sensor histidine kinase [Tahibacter sp.]